MSSLRRATREKAMIRTLASFALLVVTMLAPVQVQAYELDLPACMAAFGFPTAGGGLALPQQRAIVLPQNPTPDDVITVCTLDGVYPDSVSVTRTGGGNRITVTVLDNGFSWGPNPPIVIGETIGTLPSGVYALDAYVDASWSPRPPGYPYPIATNVAFTVAGGGAPAVSAPTLGFGSMLIAMGALGIASLLGMRRKRVAARMR
jgi:hypothetical protein